MIIIRVSYYVSDFHVIIANFTVAYSIFLDAVIFHSVKIAQLAKSADVRSILETL